MIKAQDLEGIKKKLDWSGYDRDDSRGIIKMLIRHIEELEERRKQESPSRRVKAKHVLEYDFDDVEACDRVNRTIHADKAWHLLYLARDAMQKIYNLEEPAEYLEDIIGKINDSQLDEWWS